MEIVIPGLANIGLFVGAALVLLLIPGPAVLYIVARSMAQGRMAGFRPRHLRRVAYPRDGGGAWPVGAACLLGARLQHREIPGCGLPDLARAEKDLRPPRGGR